MGSGFSREERQDTCSLERATLAPALEQADGKADQGNTRSDAKIQHKPEQKPSIFLSEDIWQRVAMLMTTKDWVRASGTCRAMSKVWPLSIGLESSNPNAVVWASKHSRTTKTVDLKLYEWNQRKSIAVLAAVNKDAWDLRQVHTLCVLLDPWQRGDTLWNRFAKRFLIQTNDPQRWTWMSEMLSRACSGKQLYLNGEGMRGPPVTRCGLPPLVHLTHLGVSTIIHPCMSHSIKQLPALQHLTISKGPGLQDMERLCPLNLTDCSALQDLTLENVRLGGLTFPAGVKLHLDWQDSQWLLGGWDRICDRYTTLKIQCTAPFRLAKELREMFLWPCPVLRELYFHDVFYEYMQLPLLLLLPDLILSLLRRSPTPRVVLRKRHAQESCILFCPTR